MDARMKLAMGVSAVVCVVGVGAALLRPKAHPIQVDREAAARQVEAERIRADFYAREAAEKRVAEEKRKQAVEALVKATPAQREATLRKCVAKTDVECPPAAWEPIVDAATNIKERERLSAIAYAGYVDFDAKRGVDGQAISQPTRAVVSSLIHGGAGTLDELKKVGLLEAKKDKDAARGKVVSVSGTVVDIEKHGETFEGTLITDGGNAVYFVSPFETPGIFANTWASYRGVFVQEFAYSNVGGGTTRAMVLVGKFAAQ